MDIDDPQSPIESDNDEKTKDEDSHPTQIFPHDDQSGKTTARESTNTLQKFTIISKGKYKS